MKPLSTKAYWQHDGGDHDNNNRINHGDCTCDCQPCALQRSLVQISQPWDLLSIPWPHPQVLHKGDGGGSCEGLGDMFRKQQRTGVMWTRNCNMDILWVGDFDTLHHLFNHPQVQNRMNPRLHTSSELERRLRAGQSGLLSRHGEGGHDDSVDSDDDDEGGVNLLAL